MMLDTHTNPAIIRAALEHAERTSLTQAARTLGVSRKAVTRWRDRRRILGPQWPTEQDIADWKHRNEALAEKRLRYRTQAAHYRRQRSRVGGRLTIDPTGTMRRLQGLFALGYTANQLAPFLKVTPSRVSQIGTGYWDRVHVETAAKVVRLYDKLSMIRPEGWPADRQRRHARKVGWVVPLAWDDDTIDDPKARPVGIITSADQPAIIDDSRIQRRIDGDRTIKLHKGETAEVVRRLLAAGVNASAIYRDYGIKADRYTARIRANREAPREQVKAA